MGVEKCQGCAHLDPKMFYCWKYLRGIETAIYLCQKEYKQTNANRIRAMTDDVDLAIFLDAVRNDGLLKGQEFPYSKFGWLDWLREDVKEE